MKTDRRSGHLADCLMRLDTNRVEATLMACMLAESSLSTKQILERTGLRQPEVSVGMRTLRERGWIASEPIPREGKGRPMHRYRLSVAADAVHEHYASHAHEAMARYERALQELSERLPGQAAFMDAVGARHEGSVAQA